MRNARTVLVTGAAQGLGAAIARHLAARGDRLLLIDRDGQGLARTLADCPDAAGCVADLADAEGTERAIAELVTGPVDTLIHNAAILRVQPIQAVDLPGFQATMNVGIQAGFQLTRALWPTMAERGGMLVFVSSRSGIEGFAGETAYCAAKHALEGFSKCLALEGADHGIVSVTVTPGMYMHTPMSETTYPPELRARWVDPIRLAPAFAWLSDTRPAHLSGQRLDAWQLTNKDAAS
ncbi:MULTISPECIES: SDR family oxidoreductase [unclassified Roseitalea]|uniref:SDR family NAD(P)-dependent oxidoreductase n=1 Tax=unclassified Roseitalea TaxID=2639107 RepID=UPI00273DDB67|nr:MULTISPECIES: SDR family oxidoreductase [unclassified Roseitalea]